MAHIEDLVDVFKQAWHAADERGEQGERTQAGIEAVLALQSLQQTADKGKGSYVAQVVSEDGHAEHLEAVQDHNWCLVTGFEEAVKAAEAQVTHGHRKGVIEVVEVAVVRRAIVKRAVEVSYQ